MGRVRFLLDDAPHERLKPGLKCWLFEVPTLAAEIEILD